MRKFSKVITAVALSALILGCQDEKNTQVTQVGQIKDNGASSQESIDYCVNFSNIMDDSYVLYPVIGKNNCIHMDKNQNKLSVSVLTKNGVKIENWIISRRQDRTSPDVKIVSAMIVLNY